MKKIGYILAGILLISAVGCGKKEELPQEELKESQLQSVCELATLETYYHNTVRMDDKKQVLWWDTKTQLWIEYSGIVKVGVDFSEVSMKVEGDVIQITIPEAKVLDYKVDEASLTEDSYLVGKSGLFAPEISAEKQSDAFAAAEEKMKETAENDKALLLQARQRAETLLEEYARNIGELQGKEYQVEFVKP
ncbi:MAG: DUF4230 domain-containing protein [Lachnospiraceae bacterium]|nr:DUF4230 domain-containing protein [Lachnospiraceae bacterium]